MASTQMVQDRIATAVERLHVERMARLDELLAMDDYEGITRERETYARLAADCAADGAFENARHYGLLAREAATRIDALFAARDARALRRSPEVTLELLERDL